MENLNKKELTEKLEETKKALKKAIVIIENNHKKENKNNDIINAFLSDKKAQQKKEEGNSSYELPNLFTKDILITFDKGMNNIQYDPLTFVLLHNIFFMYLKNERNKDKAINITNVDYDTCTISFVVNLAKFTNKQISFYNREYELNLPLETTKQEEYDLLDQRMLDFLESANALI